MGSLDNKPWFFTVLGAGEPTCYLVRVNFPINKCSQPSYLSPNSRKNVGKRGAHKGSNLQHSILSSFSCILLVMLVSADPVHLSIFLISRILPVCVFLIVSVSIFRSWTVLFISFNWFFLDFFNGFIHFQFFVCAFLDFFKGYFHFSLSAVSTSPFRAVGLVLLFPNMPSLYKAAFLSNQRKYWHPPWYNIWSNKTLRAII